MHKLLSYLNQFILKELHDVENQGCVLRIEFVIICSEG